MHEKQLLQAVLALPAPSRAKLARELLASLDGTTDAGADDAWVAEIDRRAREVEDGAVEIHDWQEVRRRIQSEIERE